MSEAAVLTEVADGVMTITINRPKAKNAVNKDVAEGIAAALDALDADERAAVDAWLARSPNARREREASGPSGARHFRVAILGAGFGGLGMAIQLRQHGEHR